MFVLSSGFLDNDFLGTDELNRKFEDIKAGDDKNVEDAMIGVAASDQADMLVTNDIRFAKKMRQVSPSLIVYNSTEFRVFVDAMGRELSR